MERQRAQASLVLKVLEARTEDEGEKLLTFLVNAKLLTLKDDEKMQLTRLLEATKVRGTQ